MRKYDIDTRVERLTKATVFISLKDHQPNFMSSYQPI